MKGKKPPRRRVIDWKHLGAGTYKYSLDCGHTAERVGRYFGGSIYEQPAKTTLCYRCDEESRMVPERITP